MDHEYAIEEYFCSQYYDKLAEKQKKPCKCEYEDNKFDEKRRCKHCFMPEK